MGNTGESEILRRVLDSLPQRISWKNTKSEYIGCNDKFALSVGLADPSFIVGKTEADLAGKIHDADKVLTAPLYDADGSVVGMVASYGDALSQSEYLYQAILKASPDCIALTTLEVDVVNVSHSCLKMFGWSEEELQGRSVMDFIVAQDKERAMSRITLMFQGIMTGPGEYRGIHKNGKVFPIEVNAEFIRDADLKPTGILFIIRDIS